MKDEEVAFRIVRLYFEEIARLGFKRQLDLDQMINSYFYTLNKLKNKEDAMRKIEKRIVAEEKQIAKKEVVGAGTTVAETTTSTAPSTTYKRTEVVEETDIVPEAAEEPPRAKTITEIIEEEK
jgi:uncharacterized protein YlxW (UPF0749 family)